MPTVTARPPGIPCWVDLMTTDVDAALDFYAAVFGWTYERSGPDFGGYAMAFRDGRAAAGIGPINGDYPPSWSVYLSTPDLDASLATAAAAGGQILAPAMSIEPMGRMAVIADPTMAVVGFWEAGEFPGFECVGEPGFLTWTDVQSTDVDASRAFLGALFPYVESVPDPAPPMDGYRQLAVEGMAVIGSMPAFAVPVSFWMTYFGVEDVDVATAIATERGATLLHGPEATPFGPLATLSDPQGAVFSIVGN